MEPVGKHTTVVPPDDSDVLSGGQRETVVVTLRISNSSSFEEWATHFDGPEIAAMHAEYGLHVLFRGVSKEDAKKAIVIIQSESFAVERFLAENAEYITRYLMERGFVGMT